MIVKYSRESISFLGKQTTKTVERIKEAIKGLTANPPVGDIAPLKGYTDNRKRLRVGSWRVIFRFTDEGEISILLILDIGNRGDIYK